MARISWRVWRILYKARWLLLIVVLMGTLALWIVEDAQRERAIGLLDERLHNSHNLDYGEMYLLLDSFDPADMTMHCYAHFEPGMKLQSYGNKLVEGNNTDMLGDALIQTIPPDYSHWSGELAPIVGPNMSVSGQFWGLKAAYFLNEVEMKMKFAGGGGAFPFDTYQQQVLFHLYPPEGVTIEEGRSVEDAFVPVQFRIINRVTGFSVATWPLTSYAPNILVIRLDRSSMVGVTVMLIWFVVTALSMIVLFRAWVTRKHGDPIGLLVGVAALVVAIPAMRFALVPSEINSLTLLDRYLLMPLAITVAAVLLGGWVTIRAYLFRDTHDRSGKV